MKFEEAIQNVLKDIQLNKRDVEQFTNHANKIVKHILDLLKSSNAEFKSTFKSLSLAGMSRE